MSNSRSIPHLAALGLLLLSTAIAPTASAQSAPPATTQSLPNSSKPATDLGGVVRVQCSQAFELGVFPEHCGVGPGNSPITINPDLLEKVNKELYNIRLRGLSMSEGIGIQLIIPAPF